MKHISVLLLSIFLVACADTGITSSNATATYTAAPASLPTKTQAPELNVGPEIKTALESQGALKNGVLNTKQIHSEDGKTEVALVAESFKIVKSNDSSVLETSGGNIITASDKDGNRYIWNNDPKAMGWVGDVEYYNTYESAAGAPHLELSGFEDGSANLITALYVAEHPGLISENAEHPYYKIKTNGNGNIWWYEISFFRDNQS